MSCHLICAKSTGTALMLTPRKTYRQTFQWFFDRWLVELKTNLEHLVSAADHYNDNDNEDIKDDSNLVQLVDKCIAGWRPTTAIHLFYSKSGLQLEAKLADLILVLSTGDFGDLSVSQIKRVDELQKKTVYKERVISEKMAT
ncbi:hypothetical protein Tco_1135507 [Tanacetum coccineum]